MKIGIISKIIFLIITTIKFNSIHGCPLVSPQHIPSIEKKTIPLKSPLIAGYLVDKNYGRPSKCPIKSDLKVKDLYSNLILITEGLKYGKCLAKNQNSFNSMDTMLSNPQQFFPVLPNSTPRPVANDPQAMQQRQAQAFSFINTLVTDEDCMYDIKKRGLIPVIADTIIGMGHVSSYSFTPTGLLFGVVGVTFGSVLKVIYRLFISQFNWQNPQDRIQFINLNCSFYDLRRQIEAYEVLNFRDEHYDLHLSRIETAVSKVSTIIKTINNEVQNVEKLIQNQESSYIINQLGNNHIELKKLIDDLLKNINESENEEPSEDKLKFIKLLTQHSRRLQFLLSQKRNKPEYIDYLVKLLQEFEWSTLKSKNETKEDEFYLKYGNPIIYYLKQYHTVLESETLQEKTNFLKCSSSPTSTKNEDTINMIRKNYDVIDQQFTTALNDLSTQFALFKEKDRKKKFDSFDDGAHATYDVIIEYRAIQNILGGKLGYSFVKFFRRSLRKQNKLFLSSYKKFKKIYYFNQTRTVKNSDVPWACRDAQQLRVIWENANSSAEIINDYIYTNEGIMHNFIKKYMTLFGFIPRGRSYSMRLLRNVKAVKIAEGIIVNKEKYNKKKIRKYGYFKKLNTGELLLDLHQSERVRKIIENFIETHQCVSYL